MPEAHFYDNLNATRPIKLDFQGTVQGGANSAVHLVGKDSMEILVRGVLTSGYGLHRFLSELQTQIDRHDANPERLYLSGRIEDFFDMGGY